LFTTFISRNKASVPFLINEAGLLNLTNCELEYVVAMHDDYFVVMQDQGAFEDVYVLNKLRYLICTAPLIRIEENL
jgi:hypothetical protein